MQKLIFVGIIFCIFGFMVFSLFFISACLRCKQKNNKCEDRYLEYDWDEWGVKKELQCCPSKITLYEFNLWDVSKPAIITIDASQCLWWKSDKGIWYEAVIRKI